LYVGKEAATGAFTSFAGAQAGKIIGPALSKLGNSVGGWFKNSFQTYAQESLQTVLINGKPITTTIDVGIKATKQYVSKALGSKVFQVGAYNEIRGLEAGLDAHHVGQKAIMKKFIAEYDLQTAPAILVPEVGHTIKGVNGIVSRSTAGFKNARQVLARDVFELRRVYPNVPNGSLQELIKLNKTMYPIPFIK